MVDARELAAIATLWKRERRTFTASFGGVSMLPTIAPGAPLEIVCGDEATTGDVILFLHRGQVVVHRLLATRGDWMLTRGDANPVPDLPITRDALVGRVAAPRYDESAWQRRSRLIVTSVFRIAPRLSRLLIALLWQIRRAWLGSAGLFLR
ncbi:MAG TPA: S24 family peptidase, partial [Thermoanaerobaculia bacterium]|nr:S24 family peptidase [Thermoanaerobaculia bacterium]